MGRKHRQVRQVRASLVVEGSAPFAFLEEFLVPDHGPGRIPDQLADRGSGDQQEEERRRPGSPWPARPTTIPPTSAGLGPDWPDDSSSHAGIRIDAGHEASSGTVVHVLHNTIYGSGWPESPFPEESGLLLVNPEALTRASVDAPGALSPPVTRDLLGLPRPQGAAPDIGAYERATGGGSTCTLSCSATVPSSGTPGQGLSFVLTVRPSGCSGGTPSVSWSFGDGGSGSGSSNTHAYATSGSFAWSATATLDGQSCTRSGSVTVTAVPSAYQAVIGAVTHAPGADQALFRTDVAVVNRAATSGNLVLTFAPAGEIGSSVEHAGSSHEARTRGFSRAPRKRGGRPSLTDEPAFRPPQSATMCVMNDGVNVRDLRQNLSVHLRLVKAGRTLRVLERGRPVALLTPLPGNANALERLVSEGRAVPPRLSLSELPPPRKVRGELTASDALQQQRDED